MRACIHEYCSASGQMVNLEKSSVVFSTNTPKEVKDEIEGCLGVHVVDNPIMYLGIPSFGGKTRYKALEYVKNRIVRKLKGWKQ